MINIALYLMIGLGAGIAGGILGIGGGSLMIPALIYMFGFSQHQAQGTTLACMVLPIGLLAAYKYYQSGNVNMTVALFMALGFFFGGFIGAKIAVPIPDIILKRVFGTFLMIVSLYMIFGKH